MLTHWLTLRSQLDPLRSLILGRTMVAAWSQDRDELILVFSQEENALALHVSTRPHGFCVLPRIGTARARKNTLSFFTECHGYVVQQLDLALSERCFRISLGEGGDVYLAFSSTRSNVLWCRAAEIDTFTKVTLPYDPVHLVYGDEISRSDLSDVNVSISPPWGVLNRSGALLLDPTAGSTEEITLYEDIHEAIEHCLRIQIWQRPFREKHIGMVRAVEKETARLERKLSSIARVEDLEHRASQWEHWAHLLMIHLHVEPSADHLIVVPDLLTDPRIIAQIPVLPGESALTAAQRYYDKARQARHSRSHVERLRTLTQQRLIALKSVHETLYAAGTLKELQSIQNEWRILMPDHDQSGSMAERFPFRRFFVDGDLEVWVGKSSENNDLLTTRHARPQDLWFHARGVGGSHVVLRLEKNHIPSKKAILQTAAIAAYYSKYRKAGNVPVAYTEKKYVRKPSKAKPGSVIMEKEKVVLVAPALPHPASDEHEERSA